MNRSKILVIEQEKDIREIISRNLQSKGYEVILSPTTKGVIRLLRENPDIVHLQHGWLLYGDKISSLLFPVLLFFLRLLNKPIVVTMHTVVKRNAHLYKSKIVNFIAKIAIIFLTRTIVKLSSGIIVHNYLMKETLKNAYSLEKEEKKIFIIPHGVKKALGKPRKREDETIRILSLGFIRRGSGIEHLVEAFKSFSASYPNAVLVVAGGRHAHDGKGYIEVIRKVLSNPPKNVIFTNFCHALAPSTAAAS